MSCSDTLSRRARAISVSSRNRNGRATSSREASRSRHAASPRATARTTGGHRSRPFTRRHASEGAGPSASNAASAAAFVQNVLAQFGRVDVLVNNAGLLVSATSLLDCSEEDWERTFAINVRSVFLLSRAVLPDMIKRRKGVIVNIGSAAGLAARKRMAAYSASKGAIISLTRAMAADHGLEGIRVNCVCPGPVMTPAFKQWLDESENPQALRSKRESEQLLGCLGEPENIAQAVVFLASDDAAWITGVSMPVDGGSTA